MTLSGWVVVFDLDDTLISEIEYQKSGIAVVEQYISSLYGISFDGCIQSALDAGIYDLWGWACEQLNLPVEVKISLLWIYRLHRPSIKLADGVRPLLKALEKHGAQLAILSDGRSITQRLKLNAVGLGETPVFLSEDYGSTKPEPQRFVAIENTWPGCRYAYVADNPSKDFFTPRARNWLSVGAAWVTPRIHPLPDPQNPTPNFPHCWLQHPSEVFHLIASS